MDSSDNTTFKKNNNNTRKLSTPPSVPCSAPKNRQTQVKVNKLTHTSKVVHDNRDLFVYILLALGVAPTEPEDVRGGGGAGGVASDLAVTLLGFPDVKKFLEDYIRTYYTAYTHTRSRARASWRRFKSLFFLW